MSPAEATPVVTLDVWRVHRRAVPAALWQVARLPRRLRRGAGTGTGDDRRATAGGDRADSGRADRGSGRDDSDDVAFVKLLGTGRDRRFGPAAVDPRRWAALTVWAGPPGRIAAFDRIATAHCRLTLRPLASRGRWAGREPFGRPSPVPGDPARPVLVLTRARLRPARAVRFWRAIGPVAAALPHAPGLLTAFGFGEAPVGFQGTVSVWAGESDVSRFAYRTAEHADVVAATPVHGWYAEELFARLAVLDVVGDLEVIGWNAARE